MLPRSLFSVSLPPKVLCTPRRLTWVAWIIHSEFMRSHQASLATGDSMLTHLGSRQRYLCKSIILSTTPSLGPHSGSTPPPGLAVAVPTHIPFPTSELWVLWCILTTKCELLLKDLILAKAQLLPPGDQHHPGLLTTSATEKPWGLGCLAEGAQNQGHPLAFFFFAGPHLLPPPPPEVHPPPHRSQLNRNCRKCAPR